MNKNIKTITKYSLKEQFFGYMPKKNIPNMPKNYLLRLLALLWTYLVFGFIFYSSLKTVGEIFLREGNSFMYFTSFGFLLSMVVILLYVPRILSDFFSKENLSNYQTMPIDEGELFIGKILGGALGFLDFFLFFIICLLIYFDIAGFDIVTLILGLINFLPLILSVYGLIPIIILLIKKFTNVNKHPKLFKNLGYLLMFAMIGVIYYFSFTAGESSGSGNSEMGSVISAAMSKSEPISKILISSRIFGYAMGGSLSQKLIFTLILLAIAFLICFIGKKLADKYYYDSVFDGAETKAKETKKRPAKAADFRTNSQFKTILKRDLKLLTGNIAFLSQPIMMMIIFSVLGFSTGRNIVKEVDPIELQSSITRIILLAGSMAMGLIIWINGSSGSSALSREGKAFYLFQTLPIDYKAHYRARVAASSLVTIGFSLIISLVIGIILKLGSINTLMIFIGLTLSGILSSIISVYIGSLSVKTRWEKPQEIMQGRGLAFAFYIGSIVLIVGLIFLFGFLSNMTNSPIIAMGVDLAIVLIISLIFLKLGLGKYKKGFMDVR